HVADVAALGALGALDALLDVVAEPHDRRLAVVGAALAAVVGARGCGEQRHQEQRGGAAVAHRRATVPPPPADATVAPGLTGDGCHPGARSWTGPATGRGGPGCRLRPGCGARPCPRGARGSAPRGAGPRDEG